ncbi:MAG: PEP-CTERM sorting domain-containing protein [Pseudomonadota bacterium]
MKSTLKTLVAALAFGSTLGFTASANAGVIDLFSEPILQSVTDTTVTGAVVSQFGLGANILGGYRDLSIDMVAGAGGTHNANLEVAGGNLSWSNSTNVRSVAKVQWDGNDAATPGALNYTGLGGVNLTAGCGVGPCKIFNALINSADLGFNYQIGIYTDASNYTLLDSGTLFGIGDGLFDTPGPYNANYDFDWFALSSGNYNLGGLPFTITKVGSGANLTNVGAIEFVMFNTGVCYQSGITCSASVDLEIDSLTTVPEPTSLLLFGLGLVGLASLRRRKQA